MEKLIVDLENCYGIKLLKHVFSTFNGKAFLIYAPNGSMKTSFAKVFDDISNNKKPSDTLFPNRPSKFVVTDEENNSISPEKIFVVKPFSEDFVSAKTATLLVNQDLRQQYTSVVNNLNQQAERIFFKLSDVALMKKGVQREISSAFGYEENQSLNLLEHLATRLSTDNNPRVEKYIYREIFNEKVLSFISSPEIVQQLREYVNRYNELIDNSFYFRKGLFDHNNANNVGKSLAQNGFFVANHSIRLSSQDFSKVDVSSQSELENVINSEKTKNIKRSRFIEKIRIN